MKIVETVDVIDRGSLGQSAVWKRACKDVRDAIRATDWPVGSGRFLLNPGKVKHANGVEPIKHPCLSKLHELGWQLERLPQELAGVRMGNLDALRTSKNGLIGFEWETGNISSSHRAINKIFHAMLKGGLLGGILVVPSHDMRPFITDRVGNITELREYFAVWQAIAFERGALRASDQTTLGSSV